MSVSCITKKILNLSMPQSIATSHWDDVPGPSPLAHLLSRYTFAVLKVRLSLSYRIYFVAFAKQNDRDYIILCGFFFSPSTKKVACWTCSSPPRKRRGSTRSRKQREKSPKRWSEDQRYSKTNMTFFRYLQHMFRPTTVISSCAMLQLWSNLYAFNG